MSPLSTDFRKVKAEMFCEEAVQEHRAQWREEATHRTLTLGDEIKFPEHIFVSLAAGVRTVRSTVST